VKLEIIGRLRSAHERQEGTPIQPVYGEEEAAVEIGPRWREALRDLEGFDRVWLLTHLDRAGEYRLRVVPYRDEVERGLFSTRAPARPSPIGLSCVRLLSVDQEAGILRIGPVDLLDGTPVLDVKPYLPEFDSFPDARAGWFDASGVDRDRADGRFADRDRPPGD
jgi:tRNA-Thr(GGU) m(6)t(6)A37 methyltransferase TsaA